MSQSPILQTAAQIALYLMKLLALWIFLRGHNQPGGGFIAGLIASAAIVLQGLAFGVRQAQSVFPWPFTRLIAIGLLLAAGTGTAGLLLGYPFLTHTFGHVDVPYFGDFELASAALFDLGVFLTVIGSTKGIIMVVAADWFSVTAGPPVDVLEEDEEPETAADPAAAATAGSAASQHGPGPGSGHGHNSGHGHHH